MSTVGSVAAIIPMGTNCQILTTSCDQQPKIQFNAAQTDEITYIARDATAQDRLRLDAIEAKLKLSNDGEG